jgi:hypothetical protein
VPDLRPWSTQGAANVVDIADRAVRQLGHVAVDGTADISDRAARALGTADITDRLARVLGHVIIDGTAVADISDRAARALGVADISDRAARALGVADISDRAARALGVADVTDRGARRIGAITKPLQWTQVGAPGVNVQATTTRAAAGAGIRHVCTAIIATLVTNAAPPAGFVNVFLRDGATGVGAVLLQGALGLQAVAGARDSLIATDLFIPGSANTAMTLECDVGAGAGTIERVTLVGYDTDTI